jgi:hypothetical protein
VSAVGNGLKDPNNTYTLLPYPVSGHEIRVPVFVIFKLTVWDIVNGICQLGICKDIVDNLPRIAVPELVVDSHPLRSGAIFWVETVILDGI